MHKTLFIYMAGTIKKGHADEKELDWSEKELAFLREHINVEEVVFLNPADRLDNLGLQKSVFGRDLFQVYSSQLVLVDARGKRGLGVGAEMMFAKMNRIPVVAWVPNETYYHRKDVHILGQFVEDYMHPFIYNLCDYIAEDLTQAAQWINSELLTNKAVIKGADYLHGTVGHYLEDQLNKDIPMKEWVEKHPRLKAKAESFACEDCCH